MIISGKILGIKRLPRESGRDYFTLIINGAKPIKVRDMQVSWKIDNEKEETTAIAEGKHKGSDNLKARKVSIIGPESEIKRLMQRIRYTTT
jgi:hypothetical protein